MSARRLDPAEIVRLVARLQKTQAVTLGDIAFRLGISRARVVAMMPHAVIMSPDIYPGLRLIITDKRTYEVSAEVSSMVGPLITRMHKAATIINRIIAETNAPGLELSHQYWLARKVPEQVVDAWEQILRAENPVAP